MFNKYKKILFSTLLIALFISGTMSVAYSQNEKIYGLGVSEEGFYVEYVVDDYINATVFGRSVRYADLFKFQILGYNQVELDFPKSAIEVPVGEIYFKHTPERYDLVDNNSLITINRIGLINMLIKKIYPTLIFIPISKEWISAYNNSLRGLVNIYNHKGYVAKYNMTYGKIKILGEYRNIVEVNFFVALPNATDPNVTLWRHSINLKYDLSTGLLAELYFSWDNSYHQFTRPFEETRIELKMHIIMTDSQEILGKRVSNEGSLNISIYLLIISILVFIVGTIAVKIKEIREYKPVFVEK